MNLTLIELIGYLGSILVAVSLAMSKVRTLRWINLAGSASFAVYGLILQLYPVLITNTFIMIMNIFYLYRMSCYDEKFMLVPIHTETSAFLPQFLNFYKADILISFPQFDEEQVQAHKHVFVSRDMVPVGIFSYGFLDDDEVLIHLDYVIPAYRDYQTARFLFHEFGELLRKDGYSRYVTFCRARRHIRYLEKTGFSQDPDNPEKFTRRV